MQKLLNRFSFLCLLLFSANSVSVYAQSDFSNLVIFGDSLSDTGNIANAIIGLPFPYYQNRISNGPVAVDFFAAQLGFDARAAQHIGGPIDGYNYAVAGGNILGSDLEDLTTQVSSYLTRVNNVADPNALYIAFMGGNDVRGVRGILSEQAANIEIELILDGLFEQLTRLTNAGAQTLLVSNVPNVGQVPETLQREVNDPGISERAALYSRTYNARLSQRLDAFAQSTNTNIVLFDIYAQLDTIIRTADQLGFTQTDVGCFDIDEVDFDFNFDAFHPDCVFGLFFDRFVFFDNIHPTSKAHQIVGQGMLDSLSQLDEQPPIEEPSKSAIVIPAILLLLE